MRLRQRGFTLLELTVALLVTGLILLLAVQLLGEVQAVMVQAQRSAPDPLPELAVQLLRTDIQRSTSIASPAGSGPLRLGLPDGGCVTYDAVLGELLRVVVAADGTIQGQRLLIRNVITWGWHDSLAPGLIEVQVGFQRHREPGWRRFGGLGRVRDPGLRTESLTVRFMQRARPGRRSW